MRLHTSRFMSRNLCHLQTASVLARLATVCSQDLSEVDGVLFLEGSPPMLWCEEHMWRRNGRVDPAFHIDGTLSY